MKKTLIILISFLLLGSFLRFYQIGTESFWVDEATTALAIKQYNTKEIFLNLYTTGRILPEHSFLGNGDFPVYYLGLGAWSNIFGISEFSLRSFSAIFGVISILLVFLISKELFNEKTGLIASFIFSIHIVMIEYSQEARLYGFMLFIVLLTLFSLAKFINTGKYLSILAISNVLGIFTSPVFLFFFIFELIYFSYIFLKEFIKSKKLKITKLHIVLLGLVIIYLPLIYRMFNFSIAGLRYSGDMSLAKLAKIFVQFNAWLHPSAELLSKINGKVFNLFSISEWIAVLSVVLISAMLGAFFVRSLFNRNKRNLGFSMAALIIPFMIFFAALYKVLSIFPSNRYILYTVPIYIMIASFGMSTLTNKKLAIVMSVLLVSSSMPLYFYYANPIHPEYGKAVSYLESKAQATDTIVVNILTVILPFDYYSDKLSNVYGVFDANDLKNIDINKKSVWLVLSTKHADQSGQIRTYFEQNYRAIETKEFFEVKIVHYIR
ncbi:glycosyltransferase family 39 protein [Candidatus Woesearchaeota archaeon]|nr:glycosyltransferase family 39 protein [Candidatus Woesearchaeota archaeon]